MRLDTGHLIVKDGHIALKQSAQLAGLSLCDFCPLADKCLLTKPAQQCAQFTPAFAFNPPIEGIDGTFSTFRSSSIWYERAKIVFETHREFALVNSADGSLIGLAKITGAYRGTCEELLRKHAWSNHLCQATKINPDDAPEWLRRQIRNRMGQRYIKRPTQIGTVIYLKFDAADRRLQTP